MKEDLNIEELFKEKFEGFEGEVSPDAWANISQGLGAATTTAAATTGVSTFVKVAIISGGIIAASVAGVLLYNSGAEEKAVKEEVADNTIEEVVVENEPNLEEEEPTTLMPQEPGDVVIEEKKEKIAKDREDHEVKEIEITEEEVDRIILDSKVNTFNPIMFDIIGEKGKNPVEVNKEEETVSEKEETASDESPEKDKEKSETTKEPKKEVVVQPMQDEEEEWTETEKESTVPDKNCVRVPNVFTPNGDFRNDFWSVNTTDIEVLVINVLNLSGEIVFTANDKDFVWDGTDTYGERVAPGEYYYVIVSERASNGKNLVTQGSVTVTY